MTPQHPHLLPVFVLEAEHCLTELGRAVERLAADAGDPAAWRSAGRAAHTLKGNAAMMALHEIGEMAFAAELHAEAGLARPEAPTVSDLGVCLDVLRRQIDDVVAGASAAGTSGARGRNQPKAERA